MNIMNDYMNTPKRSADEPIERDRGVTLSNAIQEARKILLEMNSELTDMGNILLGQTAVEEDRKSPCCLHEEATFVTGLAYDCLQKLKHIKERLI